MRWRSRVDWRSDTAISVPRSSSTTRTNALFGVRPDFPHALEIHMRGTARAEELGLRQTRFQLRHLVIDERLRLEEARLALLRAVGIGADAGPHHATALQNFGAVFAQQGTR